MKRLILLISFVFSGLVHANSTQDQEIKKLKKRIAVLEATIAKLRKQLGPNSHSSVKNKDRIKPLSRTSEIRKKFRDEFIDLMRKDQKKYGTIGYKEIESLYQVANRNWKKPKAIESLKKMIKKYKSANRTGCGTLYLGQLTHGDEQIKYLQKAIKDYDHCFYGDGVQVGAYSRFYLAHIYLKNGKTSKAVKLFNEIKQKYPNSIDHRGRPLVKIIEQIKLPETTPAPASTATAKRMRRD